jgi:uncharacterized protein (TIGR03084 family)
MKDVLAALAAEQADLDARLAGLDDAGWRAPTRCPGWSVADVVLHLAQTNELATASAEGRFPEFAAGFAAGATTTTIDDAAAWRVDQERALAPSEIADRWRASVEGLRDALASRRPSERVQWVVGELSARTLATTRIAETWIHTGDVADALGSGPSATPRLWHIARLAWRTLPYAFGLAGRRLSGPVAFELTAPDGDRWRFAPDTPAATTIAGAAFELCQVAARRVEPAATSLRGDGPDAAAVLELVRTYA